MWTAKTQTLSSQRTDLYHIERDGVSITVAEAISFWQSDPAFSIFFNQLLASSRFTAFRWETPPATTGTIGRPFEFVLVDSHALSATADADAFAEHFTAGANVVEFTNLGRDAILVVPCPRGDRSAYPHLAAFVRHASVAQQNALWQQVGSVMHRRLSGKPVWLSTAGAGVSWLHVRLDDRPKYYSHDPYRRADFRSESRETP